NCFERAVCCTLTVSPGSAPATNTALPACGCPSGQRATTRPSWVRWRMSRVLGVWSRRATGRDTAEWPAIVADWPPPPRRPGAQAVSLGFCRPHRTPHARADLATRSPLAGLPRQRRLPPRTGGRARPPAGARGRRRRREGPDETHGTRKAAAARAHRRPARHG